MFLEPTPASKQKAQQKGKKGKRDRRAEDDEQEMMKVFYPVWTRIASKAPKSVEEIQWPAYPREIQRIKENSTQMAELTISEAFSKTYGIDIKVDSRIAAQINNAPAELKVGDIIEASIKAIDKHHVEFDCLNLKQQISSCVNLNRFENFKTFIPKDPIKLKVVMANHDKVVVDPLSPMLDSWLEPIIANPAIQRVLGAPQTIQVKDLRLTRGGFVGRAVIPNISKFVGEPYTIEAFIPGSQIVLNIEDDFNKWVGKTVNAFVTSYIPKPNSINQMSLICSVKEYLKFEGEQVLIKMFNQWCDDGKEWKATSHLVRQGKVTGIINSAKKCGVFVEVPELNITGMVSVKPDELVNYTPGQGVGVTISDFEENVYYDDTWKQLRHEAPYEREGNILTKCNLKPVLKFVTDAKPVA
jgi:hypothetical protein